MKGILIILNQWLQQDKNEEFVSFMEDNKEEYFDNYSDLDFALLPNNLDKMEVNGGGPREKRERKQTSKFSPPNNESKAKTKPKSRKAATATATKTINKREAKPKATIPKKK